MRQKNKPTKTPGNLLLLEKTFLSKHVTWLKQSIKSQVFRTQLTDKYEAAYHKNTFRSKIGERDL